MVRDVWVSKSDDTLTPLGRKQAKAEGKKAKQMGLKFDLIICSPILRAYQTATIIAQEVGYPVDRIEQNELFVERWFGELEGKSSDYVRSLPRGAMDKVPGIETLAQLHERAKKAHDYLLKLPQENILVVAHSGFGRALRRVINKQPHSHEYVEHTSLPHAEIICWVE